VGVPLNVAPTSEVTGVVGGAVELDHYGGAAVQEVRDVVPAARVQWCLPCELPKRRADEHLGARAMFQEARDTSDCQIKQV